MFNSVKSVAKRVTWQNLRTCQRIAINSGIGSDERIDTRVFMVSLGAYSIFKYIKEFGRTVSTSQCDEFLSYAVSYADKYINSLLSEFRLTNLQKGTFEKIYNEIRDKYVDAENEGNDMPLLIAFEMALLLALKDNFRNSENLDFIIEKYSDEIEEILRLMEME